MTSAKRQLERDTGSDNEVITSKKLKANALLDDNERSAVELRAVDSGEMNVSEVMTQIDQRWSQKRRRRSVGKMTQAPFASGSLTQDDDSPSEAGIIEKLELFNFMCHEAFSLNFGPQTNFIIGRNGSGKSAILTGISVALGAKASDTDRGNSLKNLIKHGKNVARAVVTIKNEGSEAYKPEEFGSKIIVERVLRNDRPHSLIVKNEHQKTVSTTKKTVDRIIEYFGITIANPMTILTQTEAKTFLAHSTDKDKFNSFMAGTRLKESFDNIKDIETNASEIKSILDSNQGVYTELKQKFQDAKKVWNSFKDSDEYTEKKELLIGKKAWLEHRECEDKRKSAQALFNQKKTEMEQNNIKKDSIKEEVDKIMKKKAEFESGELDTYSEKYKFCEAERSSCKSIIQEVKEEINDIERKISTVKQKISDNKRTSNHLDQKIAREKERIEGSNEENVEKLKSFVDNQTQKLAALNTERSKVSSDYEMAKIELNEIEKQNKNSLYEIINNIRDLENKIREAKYNEDSNKPENLLSKPLTSLSKDLQSQRFQGAVLGPLGLHIQLKKAGQPWSSVLETLLQKQLCSFLVTNHQDAQKISQKVKFHNTGSEITVRQPEVFDFTNYIPRTQYPTILDVLDIPDKNLQCFLVDSMKIHNTVLVPTRAEAQRVLDEDTHNLISSAICFVDSNVLRIYKKNGVYQCDPIIVNTKFSNARLKMEGDSVVMRYERDLNELKKAREQTEREINDKKQNARNKCRELQRVLDDLKFKAKEFTQSIDKTNDKLEKMAVGTSKLDTLMNQKSELESEISLQALELEPLQTEQAKSITTLNEQRSVFETISADYQSAKKLYSKMVDDYNGFNSNIEFHKNNIRNLENNNVKLESDLKKLENYIEQITENIETLKSQALEFCTLEEANLTKNTTNESIDREIDMVNRYLKQIEERQGITKERAEINLLNANKELKAVENKFTESINLYNNLYKALEERLNNLLQTTYLTFQEVESVFISALKIRRFRGRIEFNIKKGTLTLKVATKDTGPLRSVESFSGGEKSYGQIAFLFAIWGPMHSRIRGLDEFDVFMDNVNRRIALKLILNKVAENPKRQTIFITPLGVANIEGLDSKTVNIHEISPPERANL